MLVFSRKKNESIVIGDNEITIVVIEIRGDKVRLGIEAPKEKPVQRRETMEALQRDAQIRQRIAELRDEIARLESQLSSTTPGW